MQLIKTISTEIVKAIRMVKFLRFGKNDYQTSMQVAPYGVDSNPIKDMIAVYAPTGEKGDTVVIGYINKNHLAAIGEHRIFSTDENANLKAFVWLKNEGTVQIGGEAFEIGGNTKNLVRFQELESGFNQLKGDLNSFIQVYNTFAAAYVPGGPSLLGTPPIAQQGTTSDASIADAKIDEIKTL